MMYSFRDFLSLAGLALLLASGEANLIEACLLSRFHWGCAPSLFTFTGVFLPWYPNDQLDLLITDKAHKTSIVLQNVEVVAANQQVGLVEVFVSPDEAQRVTGADNHGEFSLRL